jgi:hypothetical protein
MKIYIQKEQAVFLNASIIGKFLIQKVVAVFHLE